MNPLATFALIILGLWAIASIFLIVIQRGTIKMQKHSLSIYRINVDSAQQQAARWRDEAMELRRKHAKPEKRDTRPVKNGRPTTPLQDKLDSMIGAVAPRRLSPVRHAPNIAPSRRYEEDSTTLQMLNGAVIGTVIGQEFGPNPDTTSYSAPDTTPSTPSDSGSFGGGDSGSFSTDSGSFGGGDSGSY